MSITLRRKQRWFHAVAITCLSGFALCGCARGTRDLSSNLQKGAEQEALEAERQVAERKRHDSSSIGSKVLKEQDFEEKSVATRRVERKPTVTVDPWSDAEESLESDTAIASKDSSLDEDEGRIRTVSGTEEVEELLEGSEAELAEELFRENSEVDEESTAATAEEQDSEAEGTVRIQKEPAPQTPASRSRSANTLATARSGQASYRGTQEHPWSRKAPVVERSDGVQTAEVDTESVETTQSEVSQSRTRTQPEADESRMAQSDSQIEAKARIRVLVEQAKSLLRKGEYRAAYRAAQVAQRTAESHDVYFTAGEEQPADVVRAALSKIRTEETRVAESSKRPTSKPAPVVSRDDQTRPFSTDRKKASSNLPDGWTFAEWQGGQAEQPTSVSRPVAMESREAAGIRIQPNTRRRDEVEGFPGRSVWKSQSENSAAEFPTEDSVAQSSATAAGDSASDVVPATLPNETLTGQFGQSQGRPTGKLLVPRPFPKSDLDDSSATPAPPTADAPQLSLGENWRQENLDTAGAGRMPLLVAPIPPQETVAESLVDLSEEPLAIETDDLTTPAKDSKLWMLLAAAAGAFAMLFVRRRPAAVRVEPKAP